MRNVTAVFAAFLFLQSSAGAADVRVFGPAQVQEVYRVLLDRDALLLESILDVIKQKDIRDGYVSVTSGSVQECTYHYVTSTALKATNAYKTVKGPFEILNAGGIIADGEPHIHITLSSSQGSLRGAPREGLPHPLPGRSDHREVCRSAVDAEGKRERHLTIAG